MGHPCHDCHENLEQTMSESRLFGIMLAHSTIDIVDKLDLDYYNKLFSLGDLYHLPEDVEEQQADALEAFIETESAKALSVVIEDNKVAWLGINNCIYNETPAEEVLPLIVSILNEKYRLEQGKFDEKENKRVDYFFSGEEKKYRLDLDFHKNKLIGFAFYKRVSE